MNERNAVLPRGLLRPPRERPSRCRTAQKGDELPSLHRQSPTLHPNISNFLVQVQAADVWEGSNPEILRLSRKSLLDPKSEPRLLDEYTS